MTIQKDLEDLQTKLDGLKKALADKSREQQGLQEQLRETQALIVPLERLNNEITNHSKAFQTARPSADEMDRQAATYVADLLKQLEAQLSEDARKAIDAVIAEVDKAIEEAEQQLKTHRAALEKAQAAYDRQQDEVKTHEHAMSEAQAMLRQLATPVQVGLDRVKQLYADTQAAVQAGTAHRAYYLGKELERALGDLKTQCSQSRESELIDLLNTAREKLEQAREPLGKLAETLEAAKTETPAKEKVLADLVRNREKAIEKRL